MTAITHLALVPRDGLFCKDGRGWHTSTLGRGHGLDWPWPSTVLGALRTASGREVETRTGRRLDADGWRAHAGGVTLARTLVLRRPTDSAWSVDHRIWPAPADARRLAGGDHLHRLDPVPPSVRTLGRDDDEAREALWVPLLPDKAKPLPEPRWWSEARLAAWLAGGAVRSHDPANAFEPRRRIQAHIEIREATRTVKDEALYSHDVVEALERSPEWTHGAEWALGVEVVLPGRAPAIASLGSDGRLARVEALPAPVFEPPSSVIDAFERGSRGLRLVAVTPACFAGGWRPDGLERSGGELRGRIPGLAPELVLRAAMVPRPIHVSGWDLATRRPKPAASMVPPGAVYFFERADGGAFGSSEARALWLAAIGDRTAEGFGRVIPGVWNPTRSKP